MSRSGYVTDAGKGRLHFTVGLPQSGKSVYANDWVKGDLLGPRGDAYDIFECRSMERPRVVLAGDDFRLALYGREYQVEAEGHVFASIDTAARALLGRGFDVIIDETCTTQATLMRYLRIDPAAVPHFIDVPFEVCRDRALAAGRAWLLGPMERMAAQLTALRADWDNIVAKLLKYVELRQGNDVAV